MCTQSPHTLHANLLCICRSLQTCTFPFFAASYRYNVDRVVLSQFCVLPVKLSFYVDFAYVLPPLIVMFSSGIGMVTVSFSHSYI